MTVLVVRLSKPLESLVTLVRGLIDPSRAASGAWMDGELDWLFSLPSWVLAPLVFLASRA